MDASLKDIDWQALEDGTLSIDAQLLQAMHSTWPWFVWPDLTMLEQGVADAADAQRLRARIALATGDTEALSRVLDPDSDFSDFYPDMQPVRLSTNATIDAFLNRFGTEQTERETDMLTRLIFDPGKAEALTDESQTDEQLAPAAVKEEEQKDATASRIDAYLAVSRQKPRTPEALLHLEEEKRGEREEREERGESDESEDKRREADIEARREVDIEAREKSAFEEEKVDNEAEKKAKDSPTSQPPTGSSLSLSLARMMIRNRNYAKALEILNELNLANNEKSIIFADQIRFLRKLIIIEEHQNR